MIRTSFSFFTSDKIAAQAGTFHADAVEQIGGEVVVDIVNDLHFKFGILIPETLMLIDVGHTYTVQHFLILQGQPLSRSKSKRVDKAHKATLHVFLDSAFIIQKIYPSASGFLCA